MSYPSPMDVAESEDREADLLDCPWCGGSGYGRDEGPDTKFCNACKGEGRLTVERIAEGLAWEAEHNEGVRR